MKVIDSIILGHNAIFGVNHLSQERGTARAERFENLRYVAELLHACHALGIRGMMMSTHPMAAAISELIGNDPLLRKEWRLYPLVPYIQKYVREANQKGLLNIVLDALSRASLGEKVSLVLRGGTGLISKDIQKSLCLLVDMELLPFKGREIGAIFLHDALTDLALGWGVESILDVFCEHIRKKYRVTPALATKNVPLLRQRLEQRGLSDVLVMASFNSLGFYVNPSLSECAASVRKPGLRFVAMNTLASGMVKPDDAYKFLADFPSLESVVVGMSRKSHAAETVAAVQRHLPFARR